MKASNLYLSMVLLWVFAINFNEVASHLESDSIEVQQDKEGEKEAESKTFKFKYWRDLFGLNPNENYKHDLSTTISRSYSLHNQWSPDIVCPPPRLV